MPDKELTKAQQGQLDFVDNNIHGLLVGLTGQEIEWDMELIGIVVDAVREVICDKLKLMTEMDFYPYIADEEDIAICDGCGSDDVEIRVWQNLKTGRIDDGSCDMGDTWCNSCQGHEGITYKKKSEVKPS